VRAYSIAITDPDTGASQALYTSALPNGQNDPGALRINFDIPVAAGASPAGQAYIKIYGVNFPDLAYAAALNGSDITVTGGMAKGLPLANPLEQGVLVQGTVWQAFANWQGSEVTLDLIVAPNGGVAAAPLNIAFVWNKGETLEALVRRVLAIAYPGPPAVQIIPVGQAYSSSLVASQDIPGFYLNLKQFAQWVEGTSMMLNLTPGYTGAQIVQVPNGFRLYDGTVLGTATPLDFTDFIGNATWSTVGSINFKVALRGDLSVGQVITMPPQANIASVPNSFSKYRNGGVALQNNFMISSLRHLGDNRQATGDNWCTVVDALVVPNQAAA
jgi:hypothetical protein